MKRILFLVLAAFIAFSVSSVKEIIAEDKISKEKCDQKAEGWYPTALPLVNFSSDTGFGYGARVYLYNNGQRGEDYFCNVPYLTSVYAQFFQTTGGWAVHELAWDQFNLFGTNMRLKTSIRYERNTEANYFGLGPSTSRYGLYYQGRRFDSYAIYEAEILKAYEPNGLYSTRANYKYNKYQFVRPQFNMDLYGNFTENLQFAAGIQTYFMAISPWNGHSYTVNGKSHYGILPTLLTEERPSGYNGGWMNKLRLGLAYNTLDFEPDPRSGMLLDYAFEVSQNWIGSSWNFLRHTFGARYYITPIESLTFAGRIAYTTGSGDMPFYEQSQFGFAYFGQSGLGGNRTIRGYRADRFVGKTMTLGQLEVRWTMGEITPGSQRFSFKLVAYVDAGNVYDMAGDPFLVNPRWNAYRWSYGGGLVIAWNQATIVHFYYSRSKEDTGISIDFNHAIR